MKGIMKMSVVAMAVAMAGMSYAAETVLAPKTEAGDWSGVSSAVNFGPDLGRISGTPQLKSKAVVDIDPAKTYVLKGEFRKAADSGSDVSFYFGLVPCDAKGKEISSATVFAMANTETVLAEAVKKGDSVIKVKDASKWQKGPHKVIAFNIKDDFADLPNRDLSVPMNKIEDKEGTWEITLDKPIAKDYPADTKVRQHSYGSAYMYCSAANVKATADMKEFSGKITGMAKSGIPANKWWAGTKMARIVLFPTSGQKDTVLEFGNITLSEE